MVQEKWLTRKKKYEFEEPLFNPFLEKWLQIKRLKGQTAAAAVQEIVLSTEYNGVKEIEILNEHWYCQIRKF